MQARHSSGGQVQDSGLCAAVLWPCLSAWLCAFGRGPEWPLYPEWMDVAIFYYLFSSAVLSSTRALGGSWRRGDNTGSILAHLLPLGVRFLEEAEADYIIQQGGWVSGHWTGDGWYILVGWDRGRTKNEPLINFSYEVQADKCFSLDLLAAVHSIARVGRQISTVHLVFVGNEF